MGTRKWTPAQTQVYEVCEAFHDLLGEYLDKESAWKAAGRLRNIFSKKKDYHVFVDYGMDALAKLSQEYLKLNEISIPKGDVDFYNLKKQLSRCLQTFFDLLEVFIEVNQNIVKKHSGGKLDAAAHSDMLKVCQRHRDELKARIPKLQECIDAVTDEPEEEPEKK